MVYLVVILIFVVIGILCMVGHKNSTIEDLALQNIELELKLLEAHLKIEKLYEENFNLKKRIIEKD